MAARFAMLFQNGPNGLFLDWLFSLLSPLGLDLEHPHQRQIFFLDEFGDQQPMEFDELRFQLAQGEDTTFEFWYGADHDLLCRSKLTDGVRVTAFCLEGTDEAEQNALKRILERTAFQDREGRWLGLVFDSCGITAEYDWEEFFVREALLFANDFPAGMPDVLLVAEKLAERLRGFSVQPFGGGLIIVGKK